MQTTLYKDCNKNVSLQEKSLQGPRIINKYRKEEKVTVIQKRSRCRESGFHFAVEGKILSSYKPTFNQNLLRAV